LSEIEKFSVALSGEMDSLYPRICDKLRECARHARGRLRYKHLVGRVDGSLYVVGCERCSRLNNSGYRKYIIAVGVEFDGDKVCDFQSKELLDELSECVSVLFFDSRDHREAPFDFMKWELQEGYHIDNGFIFKRWWVS